jgi:phosphohistidine swiveling domain-containing protein
MEQAMKLRARSADETTEIVHFSITGDAYTTIARDFLLSERPAQAYRLLADYLKGGAPGEAQTIAPEVLDGKRKLTGDSTKGIGHAVDRGSAGYRKTLRYIYAGRIRIGNTWWRPSARVATFGPDDARWASREYGCKGCPVDAEGKRAWGKLRVQYYVEGTPNKLVAVRADRTKNESPFIIFEPCGEPPFWWQEHRDSDAALADFLAAGRRLGEIRAEQADSDEREGMRGREAPFASLRAQRIAREEAEAEREFEEEEDRAREAAYRARLVELREQVLAQANGDMVELELTDDDLRSWRETEALYDDDGDPNAPKRPKFKAGDKFQVPRAPFMNWALRRTSLAHLAPKWEMVSDPDMKMFNDDRYHTDWMLGAGVGLTSSFSSPIIQAAHRKGSEIQEEVGGFQAHVLVGGPSFDGTVGTVDTAGAIMVLKDLRNSPANNKAMANARAIITENGGELAHLAIVGRETGIPVLRVPDALTRFPVGCRLRVQPDVGKIEVAIRLC